MNAATQYELRAADLDVVLALARGGTLAAAGERLGVDASTVFRTLQRLERGLGRRLFERSRSGYQASELGQALAERAEQMEAAIEAARSDVASAPAAVSGRVRLTTTDTILHGLVAPALDGLQRAHPLLQFDLHVGNELTSLTRRDADIAVRATKRPPPHLVGRLLGPIRVVMVTAARRGAGCELADVEAGRVDWIAPDDALPEHPTVRWRQRHFPKAVPRWRVHSILSVAELAALGLGVGLVPRFLAERRADLRLLTPPLDDADTPLWLLTHPESRHLRRVAVTYAHLAAHLVLP